MQRIDYILVNESEAKNSGRVSQHINLRDLRHYHIVNGSLFNPTSRAELIQRLVNLRRHFPNAKIFSISEINGKNIHPSVEMNQLRREMSDLP